MAKRRRAKGRGKGANILKYGRFVVIGIFVLFLVFFMYNRGMYLLRHSDLFKVQEIVRAPSVQFVQSRHLERLVGRNIFNVDLQSIQRQLKSQYPQIDKLRISRKFPNRIYISAHERKPFAMLSVEGGNVVIDEGGIVLSLGKNANSKLPVIQGFISIGKFVVGKSVRDKRVDVAIDIIRIVQDSEYLHSNGVVAVNVNNLSKIDFRLHSGLDIIIDQYKMRHKIKKLGILLSEGNFDPKEASYIDLRFKEPILGKN